MWRSGFRHALKKGGGLIHCLRVPGLKFQNAWCGGGIIASSSAGRNAMNTSRCRQTFTQAMFLFCDVIQRGAQSADQPLSPAAPESSKPATLPPPAMPPWP